MSEDIIATLGSAAFAVALTSLLRKQFPAIDGRLTWVIATLVAVGAALMGYYRADIPELVWVVLAPIVSAILAIGGVQTAQNVAGKAKPPAVAAFEFVDELPRDEQPTKPEHGISTIPPKGGDQ